MNLRLILPIALSCGTLLLVADPLFPTIQDSKTQKDWVSAWNLKNAPNTKIKDGQFKDQKVSDIKFISIHHFQCSKDLKEINSNWYGHRKDGFGDIAYHFIVSDDGTVFRGRHPSKAPASRTYYMSEEQLKTEIARIENGKVVPKEGFKKWAQSRVPGFTKGHVTVSLLCGGRRVEKNGKKIMVEHPETLSNDGMDVAATLVAELLVQYNLTPKDVRAHREIASSNCPNDEVYRWLRGASMSKDGEGKGIKLIKKRFELLKKSKK